MSYTIYLKWLHCLLALIIWIAALIKHIDNRNIIIKKQCKVELKNSNNSSIYINYIHYFEKREDNKIWNAFFLYNIKEFLLSIIIHIFIKYDNIIDIVLISTMYKKVVLN